MLKLAVVIPSYLDAEGLWFTVAAARVDLEADFAPDEYEIIGVIDGPEDDKEILNYLRQGGKCRLLSSNLRSPQMNRDMGLRAAQAPYVFFLDSHIVPCRGFFKRVLATIEQTGAVMVHTPSTYDGRTPMHERHVVQSHFFWYMQVQTRPRIPNQPYQILLGEHGGMCVDRSRYLHVGGYWDALKGFGQEERQFSFAAAFAGEKAYMEPRVYVWHLMRMKRREGCDKYGFTEAFGQIETFARSTMLIAYAYGGQKYLDVAHGFLRNHHGAILREDVSQRLDMLYRETPFVAASERARVCSGPFAGDVERLFEHFRCEGILPKR
jgi:hypothetical protein